MTKLKIVIADDQTLFREGLQTILNLEEDLKVVGVADNGQDAFELAAKLQPDIVLMDVEMPVMNGIESTRLIKKHAPSTHILILSTFAEDHYIVEGLAFGASGYLLKDLNADTIISSIRAAAAGHMMLPAPIAAKLASRMLQLNKNADAHSSVVAQKKQKQEQLTEREKELAALIARGYNNKEIAARLLMSKGTVRNYISAIYSKIGTNDRNKAILLLRDQQFSESTS